VRTVINHELLEGFCNYLEGWLSAQISARFRAVLIWLVADGKRFRRMQNIWLLVLRYEHRVEIAAVVFLIGAGLRLAEDANWAADVVAMIS